MKIITRAPEDVYGADRWFILQTNTDDVSGFSSVEAFYCAPHNIPLDLRTAYVHWSLLSDEERDAVWRAWFEDM